MASTSREVDDATPNQPIASTSREPTVATPNEPMASILHEDTDATPNQPMASTSREASDAMLNQPIASTSREPTVATPNQPVASISHEATDATPNQPITSISCEAADATPSQSIASTSREPTVATPNQPMASTSHEATDATPNQPITSISCEAADATPSQSIASTSREPTVATPNQPMASTSHEATDATPNQSVASSACEATDAKSLTEQKQLENIKMTVDLVKFIRESCEIERQLRGLRFSIDEEAGRFSGYVGSKYQGLFYDYDIQQSSKRKRTLETMQKNEEMDHYIYTALREVIFDIYVNKRLLPTKSLLLHEMSKLNFRDIKILSQTLREGGFVWTPLPNHRKCILVERPELVAARFKYLKQIIKYRAEKRPIVYIEEGNYNSSDVAYKLSSNQIFVIAANEDGVIDIDFVSDLDYLDNFVEGIGHLLPYRCVLVLNERPHHKRKTVPTEYSSRKEMMDWLKDCKIPFDETMHSGELFALVTRFKNKFPSVKYRLEDFAQKFDAEVVYRPYMMMLNFFKNVNLISSKLIKKTIPMLKDIKTAPINWKELENDLIVTENKMFEEDMKMEVIIDQLMTMAADGKISSEDVKDLPDSKYECTDESYIKDIVIL